MMLTPARLDEIDKEDFRTATRRLWPPHWTDADFDDAWNEFQAQKRQRRLN